MLIRLFFLFVLLGTLFPATAGTGRYRATWRDNPATTMVIGWDQQSGSAPVLYYDTSDHGPNPSAYAFQQTPDHSVSYKGMDNRFVRLSGLSPDTVYYFVISDSNSTSARMKFRTADSTNSSFTMIAGGDSRNNWDVRVNANQMVSKLKPLFVMFGGDMTSGDSSSEWQTWMDHWQDTITSDGRLVPIVAARGNHEGSNSSITSLFDSPNSDVYFALTFGGDLLRSYTLNSEIVEGGNQASWLAGDLQANQNVTWRFAQYHKPMRPHVSSKSEGNSEYNAWAQHFYNYKVQLVVECDSHMVKSTWPVRPSTQSGNDEGFVRDDAEGTVYVGEGTWGAPLRSDNDSKSWTRESGSFNQFKWLQVGASGVSVKTVRYDNVGSVGEVAATNSYTPPSGINIWGATIALTVPSAPTVSISNPGDGDLFNAGDTVSISADADSPLGSISSVAFRVNGALLSTDSGAPYTASWTASGSGDVVIEAVATDDQGTQVSDSVTVQVGVASLTRQVATGNDDAEEKNGSMSLTSTDLELIRESADQLVGVRFTNITIPAGATIDSASIRFTVDESSTGTCDLIIRGQDDGDAVGFSSSANNISNRPTTGASANWSPPDWTSVGQSGAGQTTTDLAAVVQEIVDRGDWSSGNAMAFIFDGTGRRTAESYNGVSSSAAVLTVSYSTGGGGSNTAPVASFGHATSELSVSFTDSSSDSDGQVVGWSWNFGDGAVASSQNPSHTYAAAGSYSVSLTVSDNDGAEHTVTNTVTVSSTANTAPVAGFNHSTSALSAAFTDTSSDSDGSVVSWSWDFGDGASASAQNPSHTYVTAGSYSVSLTATDDDGASDTFTETVTVVDGGSPALQSGVPVSGLSAATGEWLQYYIDVPANATNLTVVTSGGSGDADLYVRRGSEPTTSSYDCRPYKSGNGESCSFNNPAQDRWYVGVHAYSAFSGLSLTATFQTGTGTCGDSGSSSGLSASSGDWLYYTFEVDACATSLDVSISGGSGDADLYVRQGSQPTTSGYDCRPYRNGNEETCTINNPASGTWHIGIRAYTTFSGVDLSFNYN